MKHIFIVNPVAGKKKDKSEKIREELEELVKQEEFSDLNYEVYETKGVGDATEYVRSCLLENTNNEFYRFYACGGDGTINEVANGIVGFSNCSFACYPCGSGNDFIKNFSENDFSNLKSIILGSEKDIDLIKVNGRYCININNIGFDAAVAYNMVKFKRWPLVTGKGAYNLGLIKSIFRETKHYANIYVDDEMLDINGFLLVCACNGICCGGSYYCSPKSIVDDGIMDVIVIPHMSILKFVKFEKKYKNGTYQEDEKIMSMLRVINAHKLKVVATKKDIIYGLDGESFKSKEINVEICNKIVKFVVPKPIELLDK